MNYNSILGGILDGIYNNDTNKNTSKVVFGRDWYFEMEDVNYKDNFDFYHYCRSVSYTHLTLPTICSV